MPCPGEILAGSHGLGEIPTEMALFVKNTSAGKVSDLGNSCSGTVETDAFTSRLKDSSFVEEGPSKRNCNGTPWLYLAVSSLSVTNQCQRG